jgi:nicotinate-nucleotide adenylyltransferase
MYKAVELDGRKVKTICQCMKELENDNTPVRVALYGGAFDPVHSAHLKVAHYALEQAQLDRVIFIPAAQSPLKLHAPRTDDAARLQMLRLALAGQMRFELDPYEIEKGGLSYTVDTVLHFRERMGTAELYWIVGGDQFEQLDRWHRIDELAALVTFLVLARPGSALQPQSIAGLRYQILEAPLMSESSSEIRMRCERGRSLKGLVPSAVEAFISEQELYTRG